MKVVVFTLDQRQSRRGTDRVPALAGRLAALPTLRAFERTAGDEVQGVVDDPTTAAACLDLVLRDTGWNVGVGLGEVETPLPPEARAGRGAAYLHAREAVEAAKRNAHRISVVGADPYRAEQLETVLWLWDDVLSRRTGRGWEVADLVAGGLTHADAAAKLGISQSAVSQRVRAAGLAESDRAFRLAAQLVAEQLA